MPIPSPKRQPTQKIVHDYDTLSKAIEGLRAVDYKIVLTIGSWDLLHIGHVRYLLRAKEHGDVLVVGTDSDRGIKLYKGDLRPVIPEGERCEMLSYQTCVDFVTLIDDIDDSGALLAHCLSPGDRAIKGEVLTTIRERVGRCIQDPHDQRPLSHARKECIPDQAAPVGHARTPIPLRAIGLAISPNHIAGDPWNLDAG